MGAVVAIAVFWSVVGGLLGYAIGNAKGRGAEGFWLGLLLGLIGCLIVAAMSPSADYEAERMQMLAAAQSATAGSDGPTRDCPYCAETIKAAARVCRFCGRSVEPIDPQTSSDEDLELLRQEYPTAFDHALPYLRALPTPPDRPAAWLRGRANSLGLVRARASQATPDADAYDPRQPSQRRGLSRNFYRAPGCLRRDSRHDGRPLRKTQSTRSVATRTLHSD